MTYFEVAPVAKPDGQASPGGQALVVWTIWCIIAWKLKCYNDGDNNNIKHGNIAWHSQKLKVKVQILLRHDPDRWRPPNARSKKSLPKICRAAVSRSDKWKEGDSSTISTQRRPSDLLTSIDVGRLGCIGSQGRRYWFKCVYEIFSK